MRLPATVISTLALTALLCACNAADTIGNGFSHSQAVTQSLLQSTGEKPFVSFNWSNGSLNSVNVMFPKVPQKLTLAQIKQLVKEAVSKEFKQKPDQLLVSFNFSQQEVSE